MRIMKGVSWPRWRGFLSFFRVRLLLGCGLFTSLGIDISLIAFSHENANLLSHISIQPANWRCRICDQGGYLENIDAVTAAGNRFSRQYEKTARPQ
ncbi:hypothetical protein B0T25DRAFT_340278 [Lasiosphaeria hispida]|uniref:Uncharacterized protein n=1 Tax=Lasiosphaeria hispida TaxID=260671 RepID=A0AAJ0M830_9PEZI|nr:hypothetical protein B0T25DRAFT_340278 [Lasiosphaeria hispida]